MRHRTTLMLILCVLLAACSPSSQLQVQPQTGVISNGEYQYAPIGWRMSLPWRWNVLSPQQLQEMLGKGRSLVEKAAGGEVVDNETHLLYMRYDRSNQFTSSVSRFDASQGAEADQVAATFDGLLAAYSAGNYRVRDSRGTETVGGIRFDLMRISLLDPMGKHEVALQHFYVGRVGSHWLTASIVTADWLPRQQMLHAWRGSSFTTPARADQVRVESG